MRSGWSRSASMTAPRRQAPRDTPLDFKAQNNVFQDMAAWDATADQVTLSGVPEPERLRGARVTANFFPLLGVNPLLGRAFGPEQDKPGGATVAVLGYGLWQRQFGGNPDR